MKDFLFNISNSLMYLTVLICCLSSFDTNAQKFSGLGRFSTSENRGCAPFTVNISSHDSFGNVTRQYQYESSGEVPTTDTVHTYTQPGEYNLVQIIGADTSPEPTTDTLRITVFEPLEPDITIHNCSGHRIRVEINDDHYDQYRVFFTPNDSVDIAPLTFSPEFSFGVVGNYTITVLGLFNDSENNCASSTSGVVTIDQIVTPILSAAEVTSKATDGTVQLNYTLGDDILYRLEISENGSDNFSFHGNISGASRTSSGINTRDSYFCYNISTFDACNNVNIASDTLCTPVLHVETGNGINLISWDTDTTHATGYTVIRNNTAIAQIDDNTQISYEDGDIVCNQEYCYRIQPVFDTGTTLSLDTCILAIETGNLPALGSPSSSIQNEAVELIWPSASDNIPLSRYVIERSVSNRSFRRIDISIDTTYIDQSANFIGQHTYRIKYDDVCGNSSDPSEVTSPVILTAPGRNGQQIDYSWTRYETWPGGIRNYTLERLDDSGVLLEEIPVLSGTTKTITYSSNDNDPKNIRVRAESLDTPPLFTYSNVITVELETELYFPNAFTPDGDELNDEFVSTGPKVFNYQMRIFSRWGSLIFFSDDPFIGWDGNINGEEAPEGTYIYRVKFEDVTGKEFNQSGSFVLLRRK